MLKTIIAKCAGLDTVNDPKRTRMSGVTDLAECRNVDIDDTGQIESRLGQVKLSAVASHSLFCDGGDCFVVQDRTSDAAIYKVNTNLTLTGVRSGLTKGAYISWAQVGPRTFYTNGTQNGVITGGVSSAWPVQTYKGPDSLKEFYPAPVGSHIAYWNGRILVVVGNTVYMSEPFKPGIFRMAKYFWQFPTTVKMVRPVAGGVFISDSETIGFVANAETFDGHRYVKKLQFPAHEWSDNNRLVDLGDSQWKIPGLSAVWSSNAGLCIGTPDGQVIVATEEKLIYPSGSSGATVVDGLKVINTVD